MALIRFLAFVAPVILAGILPADGVLAHAKLLRAEPAPGATITATPKVVRLWFHLAPGEELDIRRSTISIWDSRARRVDDGKGGVDLDDLDRQSMIVRLKPLKSGTYAVKWQVITSPDGASSRGAFRFTLVRNPGG
jgi:hypothetical protein